MERVTGLGGIFFKSDDPKRLLAWYAEHLGLETQEWGGVIFRWRDDQAPEARGHTVWSAFPADTKYFDPSAARFMINYRVQNLDRMLEQLRRAGVAVDEKIEETDDGRFGWAADPDGNRIELWEPKQAGER